MENTYNITENLTNLTGGNITITLQADSKSILPQESDITVKGGEIVSYDRATGVLLVTPESTSVKARCISKEFYFSSPNSFTVAKSSVASNNGTIEYSTDNSTWNTWDGSAITAALLGETYYIYFRGISNTYCKGSNTSPYHFFDLTGDEISCNGNIENLLDYQTVANGNHPTMASYCFQHAFRNCLKLVSAPELPATVLSSGCYYYMFFNCPTLTAAPELPATTLTSNCYNQMFTHCELLTAAPELPATTLASYCYSGMFSDCIALVSAPELPATTLANNCYESMFYNCRHLTTPPALPATTLANYCYYGMFNNCRQMRRLPALPATTLANNCYRDMFSSCVNLGVQDDQAIAYSIAYRIPTTGTFTNTYSQSNMFSSCKGTRASDTMPGEQGQSYTYYTQQEPIS